MNQPALHVHLIMVLFDTLFLIESVQECPAGSTNTAWDRQQREFLDFDSIVLGVVEDTESLGYLVDVLTLNLEGT